MSDATNPLLQAATRPFALPDYAAIAISDYLPAFARAFAEHRVEIDLIVLQEAEPTFENTMLPLEESGRLLDTIAHAFYTVASADATKEINEVSERLAPLLSAHEDAIRLDARLFARVSAVRDQLGDLDLTDEEQYLVQRHYLEMNQGGAGLAEADKATLTEINQRLSTLSNTFRNHLLDDTNDLAVHFTSAEELDGLSDGELSAAAAAAKSRDLGGYLVTLPLFTGHPYLASLTNRRSRQRIMEASRKRGTHKSSHNNEETLKEIALARAQRARILGYSSHAAFVTADETAGTPEAVEELLRRLAAPARRNADVELTDLQGAAGDEFTVEAHDWAYLTEQVRREKYNVDTAALRPWFEAERVLHDGVFYAATRLYGITFQERPDLPTYHPEARTFEVREADGSVLGLYVLDLYTRDTKRGGAWMNSIVTQSTLRGTDPVVVNNLNVSKPAAGMPTLLTFDETNTLFHEFGHALHGLFAKVTYPSLAGTNVFRDFVEFPSQVNEMWMLWPEVLENYAKHYQTGEPIDQDVVARIRSTETFNEGHATSEYLAAAWLDQAWHLLRSGDAVDSVADFEAAAIADIGLDNPVIPTRYSSGYFAHIFDGGYGAGYYSYIWSEVLDADTVEWFRENGGLTRENGDRFRALVLGVGGSMHALDAFREFRGRDAKVEPLLKRRGLEG